jgi:hypothetical protein
MKITRVNTTNSAQKSQNNGVNNEKNREKNNEKYKKLWCTSIYCQNLVRNLGINIQGIIPCTRAECPGAHSDGDFQVFPYITKYNSLDKKSYNWVKLFNVIKKTLTNDLPKVREPDQIKKIEDFSQLNFIQLIQLWIDISLHHRRLAKNDVPKENPIGKLYFGYKVSSDVPLFELSIDEDPAWCFERLTRLCQKNTDFWNKVNQNNSVYAREVCAATGVNCRDGVHHISEKLCTDDFLTGKCSCESVEDIEKFESEANIKIQELEEKYNELVEEERKAIEENDGWIVNRKPKRKGRSSHTIIDPKEKVKQEISELRQQIADKKESRMIHYSELGVKPFEQAYQEYLVAEEERKKLEEEQKLNEPKLGITGDAPVVKVSKLGKLASKANRK